MRRIIIILLSVLAVASGQARRSETTINDGWQFRLSHNVNLGSDVTVDLPHTWNADDALSGKIDYKRGVGNYRKMLTLPAESKGKRLFLRLEGANSVADVLVNHRWVGQHRGGYTAMVYEITDLVDFDKPNLIEVRVNNGEQLDVMPLVGDFNFYGGIYRDVHLIMTDPVCISPLRYASPGLRLVQESVSDDHARVRAIVDLANSLPNRTEAHLNVDIYDGDRLITSAQRSVEMDARSSQSEELTLMIDRPHLWNGRQDPHLYRVVATLSADGGAMTDTVVQPLGLRYFHIDPDKGFFLNGKHLQIKGVCRHQERAGMGNALRREHHDEDLALILEMGANAIRLSHYPHSDYFYNRLDTLGIIAWSEIPFVGPGGYADTGFIDSPSFKDNGRCQLNEMIAQQGNHPSVVVWGLFNELQPIDAPEAYIAELNDLAHQLDPTRPTTAASNTDGDLNFITDLMAWNRYDGWYGNSPETLARWLDKMHSAHPDLRIGISEYGAGASIHHQQDTLVQPVPNSYWHPENWQTDYHIKNWRIISSRPYVWGSFIWNMFDFGAAHRTEGDRPGINDKGLVTHDRQTRKDAFYFYKANWNDAEPTLYLAGRRNSERRRATQEVMAFSSLPQVELFVNGKSMGKVKTDDLHTARWSGVKLQPGINTLRVVAKHRSTTLTDEYTVMLVE